MGAVLHTLNIRLFPEQLQLHRRARPGPRAVRSTRRCATVWEASGAKRRAVCIELGDEYEELIAEWPGRGGFDFPEVDERQAAAGLCYTSGTTGNPKGVLYSHRSKILHATAKCSPRATALTHGDGCWRSCRCSTPTPGACRTRRARRRRPGPADRFVAAERLAGRSAASASRPGAVPTVWLDLLRYADEQEIELSSLETIACGGAAVPRELMPRGSPRRPHLPGLGDDRDEPARVRAARGRAGERARRAAAAAGRDPHRRRRRKRSSPGTTRPPASSQVRGPWIARATTRRTTSAEKFDGGWLRTGDVASIDARRLAAAGRPRQGRHQVRWRVDLLGGSGVGADGSPVVREAAVIARRMSAGASARWRASCSNRARSPMPRTSGATCRAGREVVGARRLRGPPRGPEDPVGKFDKKLLRSRLQAGKLQSGAPA